MGPLISCLMPTRDNREMVVGAIESWLAQDYTDKELLVLDDGEHLVRGLVPRGNPSVRYFPAKGDGSSLNVRRVRLLKEARGEFAAIWNDNCLCAPDRLSLQVAALQGSGKSACALSGMYMLDVVTKKLWLCAPEFAPLAGCTCLYKVPVPGQGQVAMVSTPLGSRIPKGKWVTLDRPDLFFYVLYQNDPIRRWMNCMGKTSVWTDLGVIEPEI